MIIIYMVAAAAVLYIAETVFFAVKISKKKKLLKQEGKEIPATGKGFKASHVVAAVLVFSPFIARLSVTAAAAASFCGVLGEFIIMKDRLSHLNESD